MSHMRKIGKSILLTAALFCAGTLAAQGLPALFGQNGRANNKNRSADIPTTITAMTMDIDLGRNVATLLGDVFVDDQDMSIRCNKMLIHFEDRKKDGGKEEAESSKQPSRIECFGDVVIQAKQKGQVQKDQKATAGKAVYDLKKDEITLTEKPVINNGADNRIIGSKIIVIVKENRMIVLQAAATATNLVNQDGSSSSAEGGRK